MEKYGAAGQVTDDTIIELAT